MDNNLIFDLGFHTGTDTQFYLGKEFRVIALEANPDLVARGKKVFRKEIDSGQLVIVNCALSAKKGPISFFINDQKDDWSSTDKDWAEKGGHSVRQVSVNAVTIEGLTDQFGHPYYIKCDIEGEDKAFIDQIVESKKKPKFLSVEGGGPYYLKKLGSAGYSHFQIVNQLLHFRTKPPKPPREGAYFETRFTNTMSGLFGKELPKEKWKSSDHTNNTLKKFKELRHIDIDLAPGWVDLHAMLDTL